MATVNINWDNDEKSIRQQLLQLSKTKLIKLCKSNDILSNESKECMINALIAKHKNKNNSVKTSTSKKNNKSSKKKTNKHQNDPLPSIPSQVSQQIIPSNTFTNNPINDYSNNYQQNNYIPSLQLYQPRIYSPPTPININQGYPSQSIILTQQNTANHTYQPNQQPQQWKCQVCTYMNDNGATRCSMCGLDPSGNPLPPTLPSYPPSYTADKWQCRACTFWNNDYRDRCEVCNARRPDDPTRNFHLIYMEPKGWQCRGCAYTNESDVVQCDLCLKPNSKWEGIINRINTVQRQHQQRIISDSQATEYAMYGYCRNSEIELDNNKVIPEEVIGLCLMFYVNVKSYSFIQHFRSFFCFNVLFLYLASMGFYHEYNFKQY